MNLLNNMHAVTRRLARAKGFTFTVVLLLGLALGITACVFSLVYGVLFKPLPGALGDTALRNLDVYFVAEQTESGVSPPILNAYKRDAKTVVAVAGYQEAKIDLDNGPDTYSTRVSAVLVEPQLCALLGLAPSYGRLLTEDDARIKDSGNVLVSSAFAKERFGNEQNALEKTVRFRSKIWHVVGVMPDSVSFARSAQIWMPLAFSNEDLQPQSAAWFDGVRAIGRLRSGTSSADAEQELQLLTKNLLRSKDIPPSLADDSIVHVTPLRHLWTRGRDTTLLIMLLTVLVILAVTTSNVCNLYLARTALRQHEMAIFSALGATPSQRRKMAWLEVSALVGTGVLLGFGALPLNLKLLDHFELLPQDTPYPIRLDFATVSFMLFIAALIAITMALCTAQLRGDDTRLYDIIKQSSGGRYTASAQTQRIRRGLMIAQVALTTVLLVGTGLLLRSAQRLLSEDVGFDRDHLAIATINMPGDDAIFFAALLSIRDRIAGVPGVSAVGLADRAPFSRLYSLVTYIMPGATDGPNVRRDANYFSSIDSGYFKALGQPVLQGRTFTEDEAKNKALVAIVDMDFVKRYFPVGSAIDQTIEVAKPTDKPSDPLHKLTIIGVVNNVKFDALNEEIVRPTIYTPGLEGTEILIRTLNNPATLASSLKPIVRDVAPTARVGEVSFMRDWIEKSLHDRIRLNQMLSILGVLALCLSSVGMYAVLAYAVRVRMPEFGVRMAIGATAGRVQREVLGQGIKLIGIGLLIGLPVAFLAAQTLSSQLYQITPLDPLTLAVVSALTIAVALVASWWPARVAANVEPVTVLREE